MKIEAIVLNQISSKIIPIKDEFVDFFFDLLHRIYPKLEVVFEDQDLQEVKSKLWRYALVFIEESSDLELKSNTIKTFAKLIHQSHLQTKHVEQFKFLISKALKTKIESIWTPKIGNQLTAYLQSISNEIYDSLKEYELSEIEPKNLDEKNPIHSNEISLPKDLLKELNEKHIKTIQEMSQHRAKLLIQEIWQKSCEKSLDGFIKQLEQK